MTRSEDFIWNNENMLCCQHFRRYKFFQPHNGIFGAKLFISPLLSELRNIPLLKIFWPKRVPWDDAPSSENNKKPLLRPSSATKYTMSTSKVYEKWLYYIRRVDCPLILGAGHPNFKNLKYLLYLKSVFWILNTKKNDAFL